MTKLLRRFIREPMRVRSISQIGGRAQGERADAAYAARRRLDAARDERIGPGLGVGRANRPHHASARARRRRHWRADGSAHRAGQCPRYSANGRGRLLGRARRRDRRRARRRPARRDRGVQRDGNFRRHERLFRADPTHRRPAPDRLRPRAPLRAAGDDDPDRPEIASPRAHGYHPADVLPHRDQSGRRSRHGSDDRRPRLADRRPQHLSRSSICSSPP